MTRNASSLADVSTSEPSSPAIRLSIRIPRPTSSAGLMSQENVSGSLVMAGEVPRAVGQFSLEEESLSPQTSVIGEEDCPAGSGTEGEMSMTLPDSSLRETAEERQLEEDSAQGLEALAASAATLPSHPLFVDFGRERGDASRQHYLLTPSPPPHVLGASEDAVLGALYGGEDEERDAMLEDALRRFCRGDAVDLIRKQLQQHVATADAFLRANQLSMTISNAFVRLVCRLLAQESQRCGKNDFTALLQDGGFFSAVAVILCLLPRIAMACLSVEETGTALEACRFDVLLALEPTLRALPELLTLGDTQRRLKALEQHLLEVAVWQEDGPLYALLAAETTSLPPLPSASMCRIVSAVAGVRSPQKALESLAGFKGGARVSRLELFFRKMMRLGATRIQTACVSLGLSRAVCQMAWEFFVELVMREGTMQDDNPIHRVQKDDDSIHPVQEDDDSIHPVRLFHRRHVNQILLAVMYSVARLLDSERTFQQIASVLPTAFVSERAGMHVDWASRVHVTDAGEETCDFYTFYNKIFVPPLQQRLQRLLRLHVPMRPKWTARPASVVIPVRDPHTPPATSCGPVSDNDNDREEETFDERWVLHRLFTPAPLPAGPLHHLTPNVVMEVSTRHHEGVERRGVDDMRNALRGSSPHHVRYEIANPVTPLDHSVRTSKLFQLAARRRSSHDEIGEDESCNPRLRKIARRLEF